MAPRVNLAFAPEVRSRGGKLYNARRYDLLSGNAYEVHATSDRQTVRILRRKRTLACHCDCPYFSDLGPCEHVWVALLAADDRRYLAGDGSAGPLEIAPIDDDWTDSDDFYPPRSPQTSRMPKPVLRMEPRPQPVEIAPPPRPEPAPAWMTRLNDLRSKPAAYRPVAWPAQRRLLYLVRPAESKQYHCLVLGLWEQDMKKDGEWGRPRTARIHKDAIETMPEPDKGIVSKICGGRGIYEYVYEIGEVHRLSRALAESVIGAIAETGRLFDASEASDERMGAPVVFDEGAPWEFRLDLTRGETGFSLNGHLLRGEERLPLTSAKILVPGFLLSGNVLARFDDRGYGHWARVFADKGAISGDAAQFDRFERMLLDTPDLPVADLAEPLGLRTVSIVPSPFFVVTRQVRSWGSERLEGEVQFDYEGLRVSAWDARSTVIDKDRRIAATRDPAAEAQLEAALADLGLKQSESWAATGAIAYQVAQTRLPVIVRALMSSGWVVEAEGKLFRSGKSWNVKVTSGIDWFGLDGAADFDGASAELPELLAAVRSGTKMVRLSDGTYGMLPEEWLARLGLLAGMSEVKDGEVRFRKNQAGLLDALLAGKEEASFDETFERVRAKLRDFGGVGAAAQPAGFQGELRPYQLEGLGWLRFLCEFGFGGCLADDMGVGKTAQVLALLEERRALRETGVEVAPSLVVVPKSLVFNWKAESARFTPRLRLLDYTGVGREAEFAGYDVVLTTYGTVRRDILTLKDYRFDYAILDESQAVKNAATDASKAVRLIAADHRLAMTGTPVENHLGELWSLFDFLNPGMLGSSKVFQSASAAMRDASSEARVMLARALRPFLLRRTKQQVARDLPDKIENTAYCELEGEQKRLYDELRDHYREQLLKRVDDDGINKSKIQVLEALLRLRQAACHPGLIDARKKHFPSAKFDALMPQLLEVAEENHKAIVFSQFTSLLALLIPKLDEAKISYAYLDGQTTDRQAAVNRFQTDDSCKVFLVSLKAGGVGLNLTAAEYVFLLDPWWNPAVEMQAIDRAHRIGQTRTVFAYRLIARDTVEEKVLALQNSKRDLADAIINADNSVIRNLSRDDLELLLS